MAVNKKQSIPKKRSGSETRKREPIIGFRATQDERATIHAAADRAGLTVGSYVRSCALRKPTTRAVRRAPQSTAQLAQLLGLVGVVGGDIQRIGERIAVPGEDLALELQTTLLAFRDAAAIIMLTLGKRRHDH